MDIQQITNKMGIELTTMQQTVADRMLEKERHLVVLSPTGSGKTYAYLLPLATLLDVEDKEVQAIVVTPGRELAIQSEQVFALMKVGLRAMSVYGGHPAMDEHRKMRDICPQIVFGTPGRLNDHIEKGNIEISKVKYLVIDEYDKCLEMGFQDEMSHLVSHLPFVQRKVLLSATPATSIPHFMQDALSGEPDIVDFLSPQSSVSHRILINKVRSDKDKLPTLHRLLCQLGNSKSIVFLNYRDSVDRVANYLEDMGFDITRLHGGMEQDKREQSIYRFINGSVNVLISTNLASRGLDIPDVENVIHYHLPETEDAYVHRAGRTARWDKHGQIFFLVNSNEEVPDYVDAEINEYTLDYDEKAATPKARMATLYIGKGKKDKVSKGDIVGFLCKKGGLVSSDIGRIDVMPRYAYAAISREKLSTVLRMTAGEKIKGIRTVVEEIK